MNRKIGTISSTINLLAVLGFAVSMLLRFNFGSYFCSMFIAFSFVPMMCCFLHFAVPECKAAGYAAAAFAGVYAAIILLVYFTQLTTVRFGNLPEEEIRKMAADASADPRRVFHKLSAVADSGHFSGRQPSMDWCSGVGVLVCLLLPGSNSIVPVFLA